MRVFFCPASLLRFAQPLTPTLSACGGGSYLRGDEWLTSDYYELLEVERTADRQDDSSRPTGASPCNAIRIRNPGCQESVAKFKAISVAYDVLRDPQSARPMIATAMPPSRMAGGGGGSQGFEGFLRHLREYLRRVHGAAGRRRAADAARRRSPSTISDITLEDAFHGRPSRSVSMSRPCAMSARARVRPRVRRRALRHLAPATARCRRSRASSWSSGPARPCHGRGQTISSPCGAAMARAGSRNRRRGAEDPARRFDEGTRIRIDPARARGRARRVRRVTSMSSSMSAGTILSSATGRPCSRTRLISIHHRRAGRHDHRARVEARRTELRIPAGIRPAARSASAAPVCRC